MKNLYIIDSKQIANISGANNLILSQWRIIQLNHNLSIIGLLLKIYLRLIFLTFWVPLIWLPTEDLISEAAPRNEVTFHICLKNFFSSIHMFSIHLTYMYTWNSNNCSFRFQIIFKFFQIGSEQFTVVIHKIQAPLHNYLLIQHLKI